MRQTSARRPLAPPAQSADFQNGLSDTEIKERLSDMDRAQLVLHTKLDYLIKQMDQERQEQREFRRHVTRTGALAIILLVLQALGFDASAVG